MERLSIWEQIGKECEEQEEQYDLHRAFEMMAQGALDEKVNRRIQRIKDCGRAACRIDPHTGGYYWFTRLCGLYRECPKCLKSRAEKAKSSMQMIVAKGMRISLLRVSDGRAKSITRKLNKDQYLRFPVADDADFLFIVYNDEYSLYEITLEDIADVNWEYVCNSPEGRNKSGTLSTEVAVESEEEFEFIKSPSLVSDASAEEQSLAMEQAVYETQANPDTAEQVEEAINERMWTAYRILKARGYSPRMYMGMVKVTLSKISWSNNGSHKRKKQHEPIMEKQMKMSIGDGNS